MTNETGGVVRLASENGDMMSERPDGGAPGAQPIFNAPSVVMWTVGSLIAVYVLLAIAPDRTAFIIERSFGLTPAKFMAGPAANGGLFAMIAPLFTSMFLHGSLMHIGMNSIWLLAFGAPVATRLAYLSGGKRVYAGWVFLAYFLMAGGFASLFYALLNMDDFSLLIGASGGITGLLGGLVRFAFKRADARSFGPPEIAPLLSTPVLTASAVIIALNASVLLFGGRVGGAEVAWQAHIGGYLFGLVAYPFFEARVRRG